MAVDLGSGLGVLATFVGQWLWAKHRKQEASSETKTRLKRIEDQMPDLMAKMREDLRSKRGEFTREFILCNVKKVNWDRNRPVFYYLPENHTDLVAKVRLLESNGYVEEVQRRGYLRIWKMTEPFVDLLLDRK